jgi:hypothetical protein
MSKILISPPATMTALFEGASGHQGSRLNRVEHTRDRRLPLRMKWVVESDEHGLRRLSMRWNAAASRSLGNRRSPVSNVA